MGIAKEVLWQLKNYRDENKKLADNLLPNIAVEACDLLVVLFDDLMFGLICIVCRSFRDVKLSHCQQAFCYA